MFQSRESSSLKRTMQVCIIVLTAILAHVSVVTACTCARTDPQNLYCRSSNVVIVRVTEVNYGKGIPGISAPRIYDVDVLHVYKGNLGKGPAKVITAGSGSMCGLTLKKDVYLLNGGLENGKLRIGLCGAISFKPINDPNTILPLDDYYDCRCKVQTQYRPSGADDKNTCKVERRARRCPPGSGVLGDRPTCRYNEDEDECEWEC